MIYKAQQTVAGHTDTCAIKHISIPKDESEHFAVMEQLSTRDPEILNSFYQQTAESIANEYYIQKEFAGKDHIVQVYDIMTIPKKDMPGLDLFIRMELLNGIDVRFKKGMSREEKEKEVIRLGKDICSALREMHAKQYLHRDIKPQNILVTDTGTYKLVDFGMARELHSSASFMSMKGTMDYIAPEVMTGSQVGFSSDLYSLGLVLYQLLNHRQMPFKLNGTGHGDYTARRLSGENIPAPDEASPEIAKLILKACAFRPEDRFNSATEMYEALDKAFSTESKREMLYQQVVRAMLDAGTESRKWDQIRQMLAKPELDNYRDCSELRIKAKERYENCVKGEQNNRQEVKEKESSSKSLPPKVEKKFQEEVIVEPLKKTSPKKKRILFFIVLCCFVILIGGTVVFIQQKQIAWEKSKIDDVPDINIDDIVTFGRYPQTSEGTDQTPIEWIVLDIKEGKALLLSRFGLDAKKYDDKYPNDGVTWQDCSLRKWLNEEFLDEAFAEEEKRAIQRTSVDNSQSQGFSLWHTNVENSTEDSVFLLSYAEANRYLGVTDVNSLNLKSMVAPTEYAKSQGATESEYLTAEGKAAGWWWLRSPGPTKYQASNVITRSTINCALVYENGGCARPALWVNLESGIF